MVTVSVHGTGVTVQSRPGESILAALHRQGFAYRVGCKRGGCGVCKLDLLSGDVEYPVAVAETVLTPAERTGGTCLSCRAVPVADTVVSLRDGDRLRRYAPFLADLAQISENDQDSDERRVI